MRDIQREIYSTWYTNTERIMKLLNQGDIDWNEAVSQMCDLLERLDFLEKSKERLYGKENSHN